MMETATALLALGLTLLGSVSLPAPDRHPHSTDLRAPLPASKHVAQIAPVTIRSSEVRKAVVTKRGKDSPVFLVTSPTPTKLELSGPGNLKLVIQQLLAPKGKNRMSSVDVVIDNRRPERLKVSGQRFRKTRLKGERGIVLSRSKTKLLRLASGEHTITIMAAQAKLGVAIRIAFYAKGSRTPAPVIIAPAQARPLLSSAPESVDDDSGSNNGPVAADAADGDGDADADADADGDADADADAVADAVPTPLPLTDINEAAPPAPSVKTVVEQQLAAGEIRHGLARPYDDVTVTHTPTQEVHQFHRVGEIEPYSILVAGPGELTIRVHRLLGPLDADQDPKSPHSLVILENDVVLQQLTGTGTPTEIWVSDVGELAAPKEYRVKIGPKRSTLAFLIVQAPQGMAIQYRFTPASSLASMVFSDDDEADPDSDSAGFLARTMVTEVDLQETIVHTTIDTGPLFELGVHGGLTTSTVRGPPGMVASAEVTVSPPAVDDWIWFGFQGAYRRRTMAAATSGILGTTKAKSIVVNIPVLAHVRAPLRVADWFWLYASAGIGASFLQSDYRSLGHRQLASNWLLAGRGAAGMELRLGPGSIALDAGYLVVPTVDLGSLANYSPGGFELTAGYRLNI